MRPKHSTLSPSQVEEQNKCHCCGSSKVKADCYDLEDSDDEYERSSYDDDGLDGGW